MNTLLTRPCLSLTFVMLLLAVLPSAHADIQVIVHANNPVTSLSKKQVIDLFMGRVSAFPGLHHATPLDLTPGEPLRARFYFALTGKTEAQVDAYWATLVFAGRMSPPAQMATQQAIIANVQKNPAAIAYVEATQLPAEVKVVMSLAALP